MPRISEVKRLSSNHKPVGQFHIAHNHALDLDPACWWPWERGADWKAQPHCCGRTPESRLCLRGTACLPKAGPTPVTGPTRVCDKTRALCASTRSSSALQWSLYRTPTHRNGEPGCLGCFLLFDARGLHVRSGRPEVPLPGLCSPTSFDHLLQSRALRLASGRLG